MVSHEVTPWTLSGVARTRRRRKRRRSRRRRRGRYVKWCSEQVQVVVEWDDNEKRCKGKNPSKRRRRIPLR